MADLLRLTAKIVGAYVAKNPSPVGSMPDLIAGVNASLKSLGETPAESAPIPAVNPKRSVHADYIICLEDGKRFKSLRRHLMTYYGLTAEEYRTKWALPRDYPMVAPNYAAARSELAKRFGLGRKPKSKPRARRARR
ncbi:MAG: MucR family transcriptional regulator [Mesorhizobium sp.]|nr:MucR family transcriptional regulator [Mesorhizobium sp.]MBL8575624.1 MucR family transcriptional regulator [Mesorhizobium sp.]